MSELAGYVVVEFNQASHQPNVVPYSFTADYTGACEDVADLRHRVSVVGRRETYAVAEVVLIEEPS